MKYDRKDYPRPQFVREQWECLNGEWDFILDDNNEGEKRNYFINFPTQRTIRVPFTYETKMSGIEEETIHNVVWYNKKVTINKKQIDNKKVLLHFEGSDYYTKVWINGEYVGNNRGGYARFSFAIENHLKQGINEITVRVEDSLSKEQTRGKQRYKKESWKCWYIQNTGIWKTVWMEQVSKNYIKHIKNTPNLEKETIELACETLISENEFENNEFFLEVDILFEDKILSQTKTKLEGSFQEIEQKICGKEIAHEIRKWSPAEPNLYDITYRLYCNNEIVDTVYSYFGMRTIQIEKDKILLNGKPFYLKMILDQGYWKDSYLTPPSEEAIKKDIEIIMQHGYNGIRKHQKVEDERFLYWCDKKGIVVWSEMANCYAFTDYSCISFTEEWMRVVKQNYNHPSIITWVPINESWGVPEVKENKKQQNFVKSLYYLTKSLDDTRPVVANDGWQHTISDIITIHDYRQEENIFYSDYIQRKEEMLNNQINYNEKRKLLVEGYHYEGQPIVMSEYGGIAIDSEKGWGYGKQVKNEDEFLERFQSITNAIKHIPYITGYCYTQLTDVQQEVNGLVYEDRKSKFQDETVEKIRKINEE